MRALLVAGSLGLVAAAFAGNAVAACGAPATRVNTIATLNTLLSGKTACVPASGGPPMTWQELHVAGGSLIDYKKGPTDPVDPSETVGGWQITGVDGRGVFVKYDYGSGGQYTYSVYDNGNGTHSFCGTGPEIVARLKPGGGPCAAP